MTPDAHAMRGWRRGLVLGFWPKTKDQRPKTASVVKAPAHAFSSPRGERWSRPLVISVTLNPLKPGQPPKSCGFDSAAAWQGKQYCGNGFFERGARNLTPELTGITF